MAGRCTWQKAENAKRNEFGAISDVSQHKSCKLCSFFYQEARVMTEEICPQQRKIKDILFYPIVSIK